MFCKIVFCFQLSFLFSILAGCSIHPVQSDVTGLKTVKIVDQIRCETRLAIQDKAIRLLSEMDGGSPQTAEELSRNRSKFYSLNPKVDLTPSQQMFYYRYIQTGIAYDFTFDITENNKAVALADPIKLITNGGGGIGFQGSGEFARGNTRHFIMSDNFENLLRNTELKCDEEYRLSNYVYPITGKIGMSELIDTFIDLNEDKNLATLEKVDNGGSRVFADALLFTTTIGGSASPHIQLSPIGTHLGFASPTSFTASAGRVDTHKLIIGLSMDNSVNAQSVSRPAVPIPGVIKSRSALQKTNVPNLAEQRALDAVTQQRLDSFLDRFGTAIAR